MFPGNNRAHDARNWTKLALATLLVLTLGACRQKMADQPSYNPLENSNFFADGMSARPRIEGTVARGEISDNPFFDTGRVNGQLTDGYPMPVTAAVIDRGEERFNIYCSMCHGLNGTGDGMIVRRGYRQPPSFHTPDLRGRKAGHLYDVITNGFGAMPAYGTMIPVQDRWAIVAYVRALQLSRNATVADVPPAELQKLQAGGAK
jgi:mono/diheme cytochrome c family protein